MYRGRAVISVLLVVVLATALGLTSCGSREPRLIPRAVLFGNPEKAGPKISPNGEMLAYIAPVDGVLNIWVRTVGHEDDRVVTDDESRGIFKYFWHQDSRHILFLQDADGDENWNLYSADIETGETMPLTPYGGVQVRVVDYSKRHPDTIVIQMNKQDARLHDVYRLDLTTGEETMVARNPGNVLGWVTDYDMNVRGALAMTADGGFDMLVREGESSSWGRILTWGSEDNLASGPVGFSKDGGSLYLIDSRDANAGRLVKYDLSTGEIWVIAEDPEYDVSDVMINPDTYEVEAVSFSRARTEWIVVDQSLQDDFDAIAELDEGDFSIRNRDSDDTTWLLGFVKDDGPVAYYSYDRETKERTFLFDHRPELNDYTLSSMEPFTYEARDGLVIHGYATFPPNRRADLPTVLAVHGGPWHRDEWGYNPEAQWLANRGYLCLQINFRGSTGYGKNFLNAGNKEWGGKMHDDLIDAVDWAVEQGYADPERVAIYGASYGGYAALVGATFTPDRFACAAAAMGPSNLVTFINTVPPYWTTMLQVMYERVGNPETEEEFLKSRSPLFRVDSIQIPMLIVQGANDVRVKQAESEQIVEAMAEKGIDHEYILFPDEGHGFLKEENRLSFYAATEQFLAKHLGGRSEPAEENGS